MDYPAGVCEIFISADNFTASAESGLSLDRVADAIKSAQSSVFYCIAFLNQTRSGAVREVIDDLLRRPLFSHGISEHDTGIEVRKPDGTVGHVGFASLAKYAPEPFACEWAAGTGPGQIHEHDKFVVTDFSLPTAKVFTGSSNLSVSGEQKNGDNLCVIEDPKVATSYAIAAIRIFDHLQFRSRMERAAKAGNPPKMLTLQKPDALSGEPAAWFTKYYVPDSQAANDRKLFAH